VLKENVGRGDEENIKILLTLSDVHPEYRGENGKLLLGQTEAIFLV
jgi:hypothetical protein